MPKIYQSSVHLEEQDLEIFALFPRVRPKLLSSCELGPLLYTEMTIGVHKIQIINTAQTLLACYCDFVQKNSKIAL